MYNCSDSHEFTVISIKSRLYTEDTAKVVALKKLKNRLICTLYSSTRPGANQPNLLFVLMQNSQRCKELKQFCPPRSSDDLYLLFGINPSSGVISYRL